MSTLVFNALEQVDNLQQHGFTDEQAKGIVKAITISHESLTTKLVANFASKEDFRSLEKDVKSLEKDVKSLEKDVKSLERDVRSLDNDVKSLRNEMHLGFTTLDKKILTMTISLSSVLVVALGIYTSLLQWLLGT